ncbi:glycosyltransferase family 4 protein [Roseofilum sp. BLCC_M91]|uniref:Glycosyltransferase family 4 protein n=1 Tax=Roseofilum halophilum BLCC-M91 TaxID=3022259 RepID=A0ABT7BI39_9CYAN|nr:glycosyltransferase family 4 protein [Roseofilum halophilum]MDJ1178840.1 glycosyltransferase family 4 protein [Roseofilum halophilum BLCC-M91]
MESESVSIDYLGPLQRSKSLITRVKWLAYRHLFKKNYYSWAEPFVYRDYARQISQKLSHSDADLVLCPENAMLIAGLQANRPLVLWTDAPLGSLIDYYPYLSNLCSETKKKIYALEKAALENCQLIILVSDWAAQEAIKLYNLQPEKVRVIPRGANIRGDRTTEEIHHLIDSRPQNLCKLLFIGVDWIRKGGNIALEVTQELNKQGFPTELSIVGCQPMSKDPLPSFVKVYGFIDRSQRSGEQKIQELLGATHFFILPTQAETFGIVLSEANAFGVPCLTTNIGGIPTIIKDGLNGQKFSHQAEISDYCKYITSVMNNYDQYKQLALSAFEQYQSRLSWSVGCQQAKKLLQKLIT